MTGCLLRLVLLPLIVAVFYPLFSLRPPFPTLVLFQEGADVAALLAGLFTWFGVLSWLDMRQVATDLTLAGDGSLQDGERTVASGYIEAKEHGAPHLTAPFSGVKCLGYWYSVSHYMTGVGGRAGNWWTDYEGYALVPSVVRGPLRTVGILAKPDKEFFQQVPARELSGDEEWARAEKFISTTDFGEPFGKLKQARKRLKYDEPGNFREDMQTGESLENLRDRRQVGKVLKDGTVAIQETVIMGGETVLLAGVYSVEHNGIGPDPDNIMKPFHLVVGGDAALKRKIRNRRIGMAVATVCTLAVFAVYYLVIVSGKS